MTKSDLIEHLCLVEKLPKGRAELLVNTIFDCLEQSLRRGERIEIRGFGSFEIRHYRSYQGRNPRTGSTVAVKPKRLPFFKVGKELKERVNAAAGKTPGPGAPNGSPSNGNGTSNGSSNGANGHSTEASSSGSSAPTAATTAVPPRNPA
jgi:integration host factor subunit beta